MILSKNTFLSVNLVYRGLFVFFLFLLYLTRLFFLWQPIGMFYSWNSQGTLWMIALTFSEEVEKNNLHFMKVVKIFCESVKRLMLKKYIWKAVSWPNR